MIFRSTKPFSIVVVAIAMASIAGIQLYSLAKSEKRNRELLKVALENIEFEGGHSATSAMMPAIPIPERKDVFWGMLESSGHCIELFKPPCIAVDGTPMAITFVLWTQLWQTSQKGVKNEE